MTGEGVMTTFRCVRAAGDLSDSDLSLVDAFEAFLAENPATLTVAAPEYWSDLFVDQPASEAWRSRWLAFLLGFAPGPTSREEYAVLRPRMFSSPRARNVDHFHS
jgi:hypothetical protein